MLNRDDWFHFDNFNTNNCHNIFLNEMLRYSIPVGCCYAAFFIVTAIYSLIKKFSFSRLATWLAFFLAVSMDYSVQTPELSMVMFMLYCIFFLSIRKNNLERKAYINMQMTPDKKKNKLYIVVPCYNEEQVLGETSKRLKIKCENLIQKGQISKDSKIVFVDDGSKDRTWKMISELHETDSLFSGVKLSRNRGHQNALLAGLTMASEHADMAISMDADLQDDINAVDQMIEKYYEGCDIVYGVRSARETDTFFKRFTAEAFYKLINKMGGEIVYNHADYRLMSKRALKGLLEFDEVNIFLRRMDADGWLSE